MFKYLIPKIAVALHVSALLSSLIVTVHAMDQQKLKKSNSKSESESNSLSSSSSSSSSSTPSNSFNPFSYLPSKKAALGTFLGAYAVSTFPRTAGAVSVGVNGMMADNSNDEATPGLNGPKYHLTDEELQEKHAKTLDELQDLLDDEDRMKIRFGEFMERKYGIKLNDNKDLLDCVSSESEGSDNQNCSEISQSTPDLKEKYLAFSYNVALAHERNLRSGGKVVHGITSLMDLTRTQFRKLLGYKPDQQHLEEMEKLKDSNIGKTGEFNKGLNKNLKDSKDWRSAGAVTPVKDQGQCGSCWAFSTVESMESAAVIQGLFPPSHQFIGSPQEIVSCDTHGMDQGCNGGLPSNGFKYLTSHSLEPEKDYPYTSGTTKKNGVCKIDESEGVLKVTSSKQVSIWGIGETNDMKDYLINQGPLSVAVHANDGWQTYTGGVMTYDECSDDEQPNHAVQAVAVNTDPQTGTWTIRNSWNTNWGEDGFIRITYGQNTCNVAFEAVGVKVHKVDDENAKKNPFSSSAASVSIDDKAEVKMTSKANADIEAEAESTLQDNDNMVNNKVQTTYFKDQDFLAADSELNSLDDKDVTVKVEMSTVDDAAPSVPEENDDIITKDVKNYCINSSCNFGKRRVVNMAVNLN